MATDRSVADPTTPPVLQLRGTFNLFGFPPEEVLVRVRPRSPAWRGVRAAFFLGGGLILAPMVGIIPPHAPWVAGVLGFGGWLGLRKWREHFTLESLHGTCPKCGTQLGVKAGVPFRQDMAVPCDRCHHEARLTVALPSESPPMDVPSGGHPADSGWQSPPSGTEDER